jgi:hypothetical protein
MRKPKKGDWIVRAHCEVVKDIYCSNCTAEQARLDPFRYSTAEMEVDLRDWEVKSVEPND